MDLAEVLVVIIIIIGVWIIWNKMKTPEHSNISAFECVNKSTGYPAVVYVKDMSPAEIGEQELMSKSMGSAEHLIGNQLVPLEMMESGNPVAASGYGNFQEWTKGQALDAESVASHNQFVDDRINTRQTQNIFGFLRPAEMTYDPISWGGINRPEAVPIGNPREVADIDYGWFKQNKRRLNI